MSSTATIPDTELIDLFKALSNPTRLRILGWLGEPLTNFPDQTDSIELGVCVKQIQEKAGISQSTASQFMTTLQRVGLVSSSRRGRWTYYKRNELRVAELCAAVDAAL